jgi:hypothetical protein
MSRTDSPYQFGGGGMKDSILLNWKLNIDAAIINIGQDLA